MSVTKQLMDPIDFNSIFFFLLCSQWGASTVWLPIYHLLCLAEERNSYRFEKQNWGWV